MIKNQVHSKFKVFIITNDSSDLAAEVHAATKEITDFSKTVAVKSVGVEYIESTKKLVLSLGYRDDEPSYPVKLNLFPLGKLALEPEVIEKVMASAAADAENVICHEFFVSENGLFVMVLLSHG